MTTGRVTRIPRHKVFLLIYFPMMQALACTVFKNFVWTLIAVIVYLYKVIEIESGCVLPELSDTLLALTGISSATYLVLRSQENDPSTRQVTDNIQSEHEKLKISKWHPPDPDVSYEV